MATQRPTAEQFPLALGHTVAFGVEDFLVAPCNRNAVEWIGRWPDWPFTALVLAGPLGCGKTHLAELWRARSQAHLIDLSPAAVTLEQGALIAGGARTALLDDADIALSDGRAEIALLQLYNMIRAAQGQLLLTATKPPSQWTISLADLASRLNSAMVITIDPPDDDLLASLAVKLFADRQLGVAEGVIPLMLSRGERSFAGIGRAVDALDRAALSAKRSITVAFARDVLGAQV
jgi:chromosomal replication initiation ATPase DnaA